MGNIGYRKRAIDFVRTKSCFSARTLSDGAICLAAAREKRLVGSAQTPEIEGGTPIERTGTKVEKEVRPKGKEEGSSVQGR